MYGWSVAPAGARNCLQGAHVRLLRDFLRPGEVRTERLAIGPLPAYVRFGPQCNVLHSTFEAGFNFVAARGSSCAS